MKPEGGLQAGGRRKYRTQGSQRGAYDACCFFVLCCSAMGDADSPRAQVEVDSLSSKTTSETRAQFLRSGVWGYGAGYKIAEHPAALRNPN